jgi:hypothetical protein
LVNRSTLNAQTLEPSPGVRQQRRAKARLGDGSEEVKPTNDTLGKASRRLLAKPKDFSPVHSFTLPPKPNWLRCDSSAITTMFYRALGLRIASPASGANLLFGRNAKPPTSGP